MEQDKNNRLDELFNQAKNEPSKVSFDEVKEQFIKSNVGAVNVSATSKLLQITNLKIIVMIATISIIVGGAFLMFDNPKEIVEKNELKENAIIENIVFENLENKELEENEVVLAHIKKVEQLPPNLKEVYQVKKKLALKIKENHKDTLKKKSKGQEIAKRNKEILDTAYRFPNLSNKEITANNRQKYKMLRALARYKRMPAINNIDERKYPMVYWHKVVKNGKSSSIDATGAFHIQKTEVSNLEYRTFLFDLLIQNRKEEFLKAKPDQAMWVKEYPSGFNKPMQENYFSHPAYDDYPVVCVSREGAEMYCAWLTEERNKLNPKKYGVLVSKVRLPTAKEWVQAAKGGKEKSAYPWGGPYLRNSEGCYLANFKPGINEDDIQCENQTNKVYNYGGEYTADGAFYTAKVNSYNPNGYGLYCMSGNAAEMVYYEDENNLAGTKGGSWSSVGQELQIEDGKDRFKGKIEPSCNIGFRPVIFYLSDKKTK
ncbi:MAG: formylglycine-generating enzyme family protein [Vicingaceae bacterium]